MMIENCIERVVDDLTDLAVGFAEHGNDDSRRRLHEDILSVAGCLKAFSLDGPSLNRMVFTPLEAQLVARCGADSGANLCRQIVRAFRDEVANLPRAC